MGKEVGDDIRIHTDLNKAIWAQVRPVFLSLELMRARALTP